MKQVDVCYFSGTGNTLLVLKTFLDRVKQQGGSLSFYPIEKTNPAALEVEGTLILAFPVAYQSTYPFIWRFLRQLHPGDGQPVYMLDTLAGFSGGIVGPIRRLLKKKGYRPVGAKEIIMPSNLRTGEYSPGNDSSSIDKGKEEASTFAEAALKGQVKWPYYPIFEDCFYLLFQLVRLSMNPVSQRILRFSFPKLITEKCTNCGICVELCPVENIRMEDNPVHGHRCQICLRCVAFCPYSAVKIFKEKNSHYRSVDLKAIRNSVSFLEG